ncbi:hypothetical protein PBI_EQUEMIOH13_72 [Mycobacterium phage Equemioh13]|uniref:Uncharacterized protein n=2 Tax=Turbidovirus TaxID=2948936 RepID=A0A076YHN8_9CAUD|nr:hypothetical protein AVV38_gp31 [Mycobacterium phage Piro94]YP_009203341.1 hypothetical protein AVT12_gp34 [Mycobacterium phage Equemioh13]YP_010063688.1 hypothetical protein KIY82_gp34 [Mycobacterium phage Centaur]AMB18563.1 hypothetical protein NASIATALIE_73 [Mycobacterium phage NaSiaTalie]AOZ64015.1 hypothetical protein SEA_BAEHEXIC_71 [Mycobacterium phage Baehexic]ATN92317.1 hypothetical protein SEA_UPDAWG_73 [Mycobacterium phage Updawg]AYD86348.1 hypothetical protein SEA_FLARE16_73 [M
MKEYRTTLELDPGASYTYVELGPIPELPPWHVQSQPSRWPFPKEKAAFRFAEAHKADHPNREVAVATTDGERFVL